MYIVRGSCHPEYMRYLYDAPKDWSGCTWGPSQKAAKRFATKAEAEASIHPSWKDGPRGLHDARIVRLVREAKKDWVVRLCNISPNYLKDPNGATYYERWTANRSNALRFKSEDEARKAAESLRVYITPELCVYERVDPAPVPATERWVVRLGSYGSYLKYPKGPKYADRWVDELKDATVYPSEAEARKAALSGVSTDTYEMDDCTFEKLGGGT